MKLEKKLKKGYAILKIIGPVKSGMEFDLADGFDELLQEKGVTNLIVDLSETPFVNSAALGVFLNNYRDIEKANGKLVFCAPSADVKTLFEITKLDALFVSVKNMELAESYVLS